MHTLGLIIDDLCFFVFVDLLYFWINLLWARNGKESLFGEWCLAWEEKTRSMRKLGKKQQEV